MHTPIDPPMKCREYYPPVDKEIAALPTCEPGEKPEPLLIPEYLFDTPDDEQAEPQLDNTEHEPYTDHDPKADGHDQ